MFPTINIWNWIQIYTFWLALVIAWAVFFGLLHIYATRRGFIRHIFSDIISFTLSIFFMGRLIYILADWRTEGWLIKDLFQNGDIFGFLRQFFITDNYSLSFAGGVIGFIWVFLWKTRKNTKDRARYWDAIMPAFLIAASIGYMGTLLGGQIYGIVFDSVFSITYSNFDSIVPFQNPTFPLPILYVVLSLLTAFSLYRIENRIQLPVWWIGYIGMGIFSTFLFLGDFLNWAPDLFSSRIYLNTTQLLALGCIISAIIWLLSTLKR